MSEAQRMRRGALLVPVLVLPFAAIFALDSSKSQPTHFLLVMSIAIVLCVVVVAISLAGARAQLRHAASATLAIESDRLVWFSDSATVEMRLDDIETITAFRRRGSVYRVVLTLSNGAERKIEGLDDMQVFHDTIIHLKSET